jgi:hypothetical protein
MVAGDDSSMRDRTATELAMATIGVLTALPEEYAAIETMFGPVAPVAAKDEGSGRSYSVCRIKSTYGGEHVVAITVLPDPGMPPASRWVIR